MYKILLVEDEPLIRRTLKKIITNANNKYEICGEAENGEEGIKKASELEPDIIITDICMNHMTGLEMIEKLKSIIPSCIIIILTGYRDFEYAKQAIELGAFRFLLKPTKKDELLEALSRAAKCIDDEQKQLHENEELNNVLKENIPYIRQKILFDKLYGIDSNYINNNIEKNTSYFDDININNFYLILIQINADNKDTHLIQCAVMQMFSKATDDKNDYYHIFLDSETAIIIFNNYSRYTSDKLSEIFHMIIDRVNTRYNVTVNIGLSTEGKGIEQLYVKHQECKKALSFVKYLSDNSIVSYSDIKSQNKNFSLYYTLTLLKEHLFKAIENVSSSEIKNCMKNITETIKMAQDSDLRFIKRFYTQMFYYINELREELTNKNQPELPNYIVNIESTVKQCKNVEDLNDVLYMAIEGIINKTDIINRSKISKRVQKIIDYIDENYNKNITLDDISAHIFVSASHTGRIFKKETNKNIIDYINEVKIQKAKEMFDSAEYKVYEVSEAVGIDNARYFAKLFKKHVGKTPIEYRQK